MNTRTLLLLGAVGYAVSATTCPAQTMVSTDPVGVVSTELPATGFTYFGVNLTLPTELTSSSTSLSGDEVNVGIALDSLDVAKSYQMEIVEDPYEGYAVDIASWTGQVLTLEEDIEAGGITKANFDGKRVRIREIPTISSIFGPENSAGLKSGTLATADLVYLFSSGSFSKYYYFPGGFGQPAEWRNESGGSAGQVEIHFGDGLIIETRDSAPKTISVSGSVKLGPTNVPIYQGFNLISNPSPIGDRLTLSNSGLKDGLVAGTTATADIVYLPDSSGGFDKYYYFPGGFGQPAEWRDFDTGSNADGTLLPNSGSFFVDRRTGDSSVTITEDLPNN